MTRNVGSIDRIIRFVLAIVFFAVAVFANPTIGTVGSIIFAVLGVIMLATGLMNFCPIWAVLGVRTAKSDE